jgi:hypothetical protein
MTSDHDAVQIGAGLTWRYVRIAVIALVVGLAASVVIESFDEGRVLTSISDYYYTPATSWFVGALFGVAVCMIVLRGNTATENVLLNVAGACAPVVALVPSACTAAPDDPCTASVENNIPALLILGAIGLVFAAVLAARPSTRLATDRRPAQHWAALCAATLIWLGTVVAYWVREGVFKESAHYVAAVVMFVCIFLVALSNAGGYRDHRQPPHPSHRCRWVLKNPYAYVAGLMVLTLLIITVIWVSNHFKHVLLAVEVDLIVLFGAFWAIQTHDLWELGLRPGQRESPVVATMKQRFAGTLGRHNAE